MSGEADPECWKQWKTFGRSGLWDPNPAAGAHSAPPDPTAGGGEGVAAPSPGIPPPLSRPSVVPPPVKTPRRDPGNDTAESSMYLYT